MQPKTLKNPGPLIAPLPSVPRHIGEPPKRVIALPLAKTADAPLPVEQRLKQGETLLADGEAEAARVQAYSVLCEQAQNVSAWLLYGAACKALLRFEDAAEAYRFLLSRFPEFTQMRLNLASALIELGEMDAAEAELLDAVARAPASAPALASLGSLYMRQDRFEEAESCCRKALAIDPGLTVAHQNLAAILDLCDDPNAETHRQAAYGRQQIFAEAAPAGAPRVLILTASGSGNVPYTHILPRERFGRILWHLAYASKGRGSKLPAHHIVFNAIGDGDAAPEALAAAAAYAKRCRRPLLNKPEAVARTSRSDMPKLLAGTPNLAMPNTLRLSRGEAEGAIAGTLRYPVILRPTGRHGGRGAKLVERAEDIAGALPEGDAIYATEYVDYRSEDGRFRKYRAIFVDRKPYPYHLAIGSHWLLHYATADMREEAALRDEEAAFLADPNAVLGDGAMKVLETIGERLDLDYAGIDFSLLPGRQVLFFEANATMLVHPEDDPVFAYKNKAVNAIVGAMNVLIAKRLVMAD